MKNQEVESIFATIKPKRLVFENKETDYRMYGCELERADGEIELHPIYGTFTLKGSMMELTIGSQYEVEVINQSTDKYPASYLLKAMKYDLPTDTGMQRDFLSAILTENQIENIYSYYTNGEDILDFIRLDIFEYEKIKGIGESTYKKIREKVMEQALMSELIAFLAPHGITINLIKKIYFYCWQDGFTVI